MYVFRTVLLLGLSFGMLGLGNPGAVRAEITKATLKVAGMT